MIKTFLRKKNVKLFGSYTILFIAIALIVYYPFFKENKTFIWRTDGLGQHFAILYNFNETIRNCVHNFGQEINTFSWNIGIGSDVIGEFSYYIIGDPFAYISLLFPMDKLEFAYDFLVLLRMFCIGISFLIYCKYHKNNIYGSVIGAVIYTFCGFTLFAGVRHPFFLNACIMLPVVLLGVDKMLKENKTVMFTLAICVTAFMNYYFLYMITILAVIYAIIKYFVEIENKNIKDMFVKVTRATLAYLLGIFLAGIVLFPTISAFGNSNRLGDVKATSYGWGYYKSLLGFFVYNKAQFWTRVCISPIAILLIPVCFHRAKKCKQNKTVIINILVELIMLLFATFGSIMNGFSFQQNRWVFGLMFLLSYMVTMNTNKKLEFSKREIDIIILMLLLYFNIVAIIEKVDFKYLWVTFSISLIMVIIICLSNYIKNKNIKRIMPYLLCALIMYSIYNYSYDLYATQKYVEEFKDKNTIMNLYNSNNGKIWDYGKAIEQLKSDDNSFYRISNTTNNTNINDSIVLNYKSLNEYLSIGSKFIGTLCKDIIIRNYSDTNALKKVDCRTKIGTLLANKYYIVGSKQKAYVPYGYVVRNQMQTDISKSATLIYENENALPLGVFYDSYILKFDYDKLSCLEKEQALLDTATIDENKNINNYNIQYDDNYVSEAKEKATIECDYVLKDSNKVLNDDKKIKITKKEQSISLSIKDVPQNCELYLYVDNMEYQPNKNKSNKYTITVNHGNITKEQTVQDKNSSPYYAKMPGILINLGYKKQHSKDVKITFSSIGTYNFNSIKIIAVPMNVYDESIQKLKQTQFELEEYGEQYIKGKISNNKSGILQISTPYSEGWQAYIDGNEVEVVKVNEAFIGIPLKEGEHQVYLKYQTPFLKQGAFATVVSIPLLIANVIYEKKEIKKRKSET